TRASPVRRTRVPSCAWRRPRSRGSLCVERGGWMSGIVCACGWPMSTSTAASSTSSARRAPLHHQNPERLENHQKDILFFVFELIDVHAYLISHPAPIASVSRGFGCCRPIESARRPFADDG